MSLSVLNYWFIPILFYRTTICLYRWLRTLLRVLEFVYSEIDIPHSPYTKTYFDALFYFSSDESHYNRPAFFGPYSSFLLDCHKIFSLTFSFSFHSRQVHFCPAHKLALLSNRIVKVLHHSWEHVFRKVLSRTT